MIEWTILWDGLNPFIFLIINLAESFLCTTSRRSMHSSFGCFCQRYRLTQSYKMNLMCLDSVTATILAQPDGTTPALQDIDPMPVTTHFASETPSRTMFNAPKLSNMPAVMVLHQLFLNMLHLTLTFGGRDSNVIIAVHDLLCTFQHPAWISMVAAAFFPLSSANVTKLGTATATVLVISSVKR